LAATLSLPIDPLLPEVLKELSRHNRLILEAPPGAGKTTRVPPALLALGGVLVLEPRRIAARMAARRVASEMGEALGGTVGYQVRFEDVSSPRTRLRFLTEGVLNRRLLSDPGLKGVHTVVLDEFHERHLDGDLALALLRRLQGQRRDLRLVIMSATLDAASLADSLGGCPVLRSEGRVHPVDIQYRPHSAAALEEQVAAALERLLEAGLDGDVLVFLPGAAEIRRAQRACQPIADRTGLIIAPMHGELSPEEQDRAVLPSPERKLILSTNVAESSITIEGVTAVIDSGLARIPRDSPWTGLPSVEIERVSKFSAAQRAGRAGRLRPGRVIRLYPEQDFLRRPDSEAPEITRRELSRMLLDLHAMGIEDAGSLEWVTPPPPEAVRAAEDLLQRLGAVDNGGAMARLPIHPRLAALVLEADRRGAGEEGCDVAALLSAGDRLPPGEARQRGPSDLLALLDAGLSPQARRLRDQIRRHARPKRQRTREDTATLIAILKAFPDRVGRRRGASELLLAGGGSAELSSSSVVGDHELMVAVDIEQRGGVPLVRLASGIEPEWLLDLFPDRVTERSGLQWNRVASRVESSSALLYEGLVITESSGGPVDAEEAARLLAAQALEAGVERFADQEELEDFLARMAFAVEHGGLPECGEDRIRAALESLCLGLKSFGELKSASSDGGLIRALLQSLTPRQRQLLEEIAPERIRLRRGRWARVRYARGQAPSVASRLQDFFGMKETPRLAGVPLVLHLLAPNQRPVQMTADLEGFWQRLYPKLRRELGRRYPRHAWPEDPISGK
jgi:ATP-dependent helicase HrpB